ncbi:hypothetical protein HY419_01090 [candidate division WWE3 bacterium]|nr:hypothetical protein [candidate division WWE3 bacterium]
MGTTKKFYDCVMELLLKVVVELNLFMGEGRDYFPRTMELLRTAQSVFGEEYKQASKRLGWGVIKGDPK